MFILSGAMRYLYHYDCSQILVRDFKVHGVKMRLVLKGKMQVHLLLTEREHLLHFFVNTS